MSKHLKVNYCIHFFSVLCVLSFSQWAKAQEVKEVKPEKVNFKYLYDPQAPVLCESRFAVKNQEATVFLQVLVKDPQFDGFTIKYQTTASYSAKEVANQGELNESEHLIKKENNAYYYKFTVPLSTPSCYLFVNIGKGETNFQYDIPILTNQDFPPADLLMMRENEEIPVFNNYIKSNESFRVNSIYGQDSSQLYVYFYGHDFAPNLPPMATDAQSNEKELQIDSLFSVSTGESLSFTKNGLYFIQTDTTSLSGLSFRVVQDYYPKYATAEQLIPPLIYISTSEEMEDLISSDEKKKALDNYWLKVTRSQDVARNVISSYFQQVTGANQMFTNYKEGWKTGQGMVYLLYGLPDQVIRTEDRETWVYNEERNLIEIQFVFAKVKNIFTEKHYELIPDSDYRKFWYRNIDLWRKGRKEI